MITIISFLCVLGFLVFVHELGHYLAARKVGVHVLQFSIGFPPKMFSKMIGKTEYMISWLPLGGFVRLKGQDIDDEDPSDPENYASKSIQQRFLILVAGALMNLIVAILFFPLVFMVGREVPASLMQPPLIDQVVENSVAQRAGFLPGDRIVEIDGQPVTIWREVNQELGKKQASELPLRVERGGMYRDLSLNLGTLSGDQGIGWRPFGEPVVGAVGPGTPAERAGVKIGDRFLAVSREPIQSWSQITPAIQLQKGESFPLLLLRDGKEVELLIKPEWNEKNQYWTIGVNSPVITVSEDVGTAIKLGLERAWVITTATFSFLGQLVTGRTSADSVGGPIMIAQMVGQAAKSGVGDLLQLMAYISLQLGIFNLLPIPALDGGHIFFLIVEKIKGSALSKNFRLRTQKVGFSLLMLLILVISFQDSLKLLR